MRTGIRVALLSLLVFSAGAAAPAGELVYHGIRPVDPGGRCGLANPERGLRIETIFAEPDGAADVWGPASHLRGRLTGGYSEDWWLLDARRYAPFGLTLAQTYCYLDKSMEGPIPEAKIALLRRSLDNLRANGLKALLRFAYEKEMGQERGPSLETILGHMDQLAPVVRENSDVIFVLQAGFVGAWGEWHSSAHRLEQDPANLARVIARLLDMLPPDRMTQVRVPKYKRHALEDPAISAYAIIDGASAFSGAPAARIGFHNDGFLAGRTCGGTWTEPPLFSAPGNPEFDYMTVESPYVAVDGELFWSDIDGRVDGFEAAVRMRLHHYTSFSLAHSYSEREGTRFGIDAWMETPAAVDRIREAKLPVSDGYFEDGAGGPVARTQFEYIRDHLGYRIELRRADIPEAAAPGEAVPVAVDLVNRGFAAPVNPRPVILVLIDPAGRVAAEAPVEADPRHWQPFAPGDETHAPLTHAVRGAVPIPGGLAPGSYAVGLWLPDAAQRLRNDPRYAVRVANRDVPWWTGAAGAYGVNVLAAISIR
jgi:hypothetical protein